MEKQMDFTDLGFNFLRVKDCTDGDEIKILTEGEKVINTFGKNKHKFVVEHKGDQKIMQIAVPQIQQLVKLLGGESKKWVDKIVIIELKQITLFEEKTETLAISFVRLKA